MGAKRSSKQQPAHTGRVNERVTVRFTVRLDVGGRSYPFNLIRERLDVPGRGALDYVHMDGRGLREHGGGADGLNIVEAWWALLNTHSPPVKVSQSGSRPYTSAADLDLIHYLLARAHLPWAHGFAPHRVFRWQHLAPGAKRDYSVVPAEASRLKKGLAAGGPAFVQSELHRLFLDPGQLPLGRDAGAYEEALGRWVWAGVRRYHHDAEQGIATWLDDLKKQIRSYQQRGGAKRLKSTHDRIPRFLGAFASECLARFNVCYHDVWGMLLPQVRKLGLDPASERLVVLMHSVDPPCPPASHAAVGAGPAPRFGLLGGHPLALHPVGKWLLRRPEYLQAIYRWVSHPDHDYLCLTGTAWQEQAYRDTLLALLYAASEYHACREQDENTGRFERMARAEQRAAEQARFACPSTGESAESLDTRSVESITRALDRFAIQNRFHCQSCRIPLKGDAGQLIDRTETPRCDEEVVATFACPACKSQYPKPLDFDSFRACLAG